LFEIIHLKIYKTRCLSGTMQIFNIDSLNWFARHCCPHHRRHL